MESPRFENQSDCESYISQLEKKKAGLEKVYKLSVASEVHLQQENAELKAQLSRVEAVEIEKIAREFIPHSSSRYLTAMCNAITEFIKGV